MFIIFHNTNTTHFAIFLPSPQKQNRVSLRQNTKPRNKLLPADTSVEDRRKEIVECLWGTRCSLLGMRDAPSAVASDYCFLSVGPILFVEAAIIFEKRGWIMSRVDDARSLGIRCLMNEGEGRRRRGSSEPDERDLAASQWEEAARLFKKALSVTRRR